MDVFRDRETIPDNVNRRTTMNGTYLYSIYRESLEITSTVPLTVKFSQLLYIADRSG